MFGLSKQEVMATYGLIEGKRCDDCGCGLYNKAVSRWSHPRCARCFPALCYGKYRRLLYRWYRPPKKYHPKQDLKEKFDLVEGKPCVRCGCRLYNPPERNPSWLSWVAGWFIGKTGSCARCCPTDWYILYRRYIYEMYPPSDKYRNVHWERVDTD